jgi:hypothetical protein
MQFDLMAAPFPEDGRCVDDHWAVGLVARCRGWK